MSNPESPTTVARMKRDAMIAVELHRRRMMFGLLPTPNILVGGVLAMGITFIGLRQSWSVFAFGLVLAIGVGIAIKNRIDWRRAKEMS